MASHRTEELRQAARTLARAVHRVLPVEHDLFEEPELEHASAEPYFDDADYEFDQDMAPAQSWQRDGGPASPRVFDFEGDQRRPSAGVFDFEHDERLAA
jgi:hypothetical protein